MRLRVDHDAVHGTRGRHEDADIVAVELVQRSRPTRTKLSEKNSPGKTTEGARETETYIAWLGYVAEKLDGVEQARHRRRHTVVTLLWGLE